MIDEKITPHEGLTRAFRSLRDQRSQRAERRRLEAELADFRSPAERLEIETITARYPETEAREVREILARHTA